MKVSYFKIWMSRMGFNGKQVSEAGGLLGISATNTASSRFRGESESDLKELLAMSAVTAGLKPWSPQYHDHLVATKSIMSLIDERASALVEEKSPRSASASQKSLNA